MRKWIPGIMAAGTLLTGSISTTQSEEIWIGVTKDTLGIPLEPLTSETRELIEGTFADVQDYWKQSGYDMDGLVLELVEDDEVFACGEVAITPQFGASGIYCYESDTVAISQGFVTYGIEKLVGEEKSAAYRKFIVAHEIGHGVQVRQNLTDFLAGYSPAAQASVLERHADCLAGLALSKVMPEDVYEVSRAVATANYTITDPIDGTPVLDELHGTASERSAIFLGGAKAGACRLLPAENFEPNK